MTRFFCQTINFLSNIPCLVLCHYDVEYYHPGLYPHYGIYFPESIRRAVSKRQAEFLAGRYCARLALQKLGIRNQPVMIGKHREPLWPGGIVASLSHDHKHAICLVAKHDQFTAAGVDIEPVMSHERITELKALFCCPEEELIILRTNLPYALSMTLLYSAKESLYKAVCPQLIVSPDFHSARLKLLDVNSGYLILVLAETLSPNLPVHQEFLGRFYCLPNTIVTCFLW